MIFIIIIKQFHEFFCSKTPRLYEIKSLIRNAKWFFQGLKG